ncbi:TolC family protein [Litorimonas sp. WD9-15]|uniref:TolC family protein n=1 Tax=Litorimonas sp. WD9-15 TaxID=3418716 RepID=UPI003D04EB7A
MTIEQTKSKLKTSLMGFGLFSAVALGGCASTAVKYDSTNVSGYTDSTLRPQAVPLEADVPLNINDVRARTLAHNSEFARAQSQLMETVRKAGMRGKDFLPQAYASSYGTWRNNTSASVGKKVDDTSGTMPKDFYTAQDQAAASSSLTTSWDLLEIGLSGFKANRRAINAYSQSEQNQYLCNKMMVDVENAYWRAVAFEQAEKKSAWLKGRVAYALDLSQQRADQNPETKLQELMFQRELIDINRWYQSLYRSLLSAKPELARLMNVPAGTEFDLEATRLPSNLGELGKHNPLELISTAYQNRPEIRQALYQTDLTELKNEEDLWRHLPAMRFFLGANHNTNSFVLNQDFASAGLNLSWDLLRLGQIGETKRNGKLALAEQQRQTEILASAVMAQVMIAREQMHKLDYDLTLAWKALSIQGEITNDLNTDVKSGAKPETYLIKEELMRELSFIREQMARAELHTAKARLEQSIGIVPTCQAPTQIQASAPSPAAL